MDYVSSEENEKNKEEKEQTHRKTNCQTIRRECERVPFFSYLKQQQPAGGREKKNERNGRINCCVLLPSVDI